jgi:hypothetical protein
MEKLKVRTNEVINKLISNNFQMMSKYEQLEISNIIIDNLEYISENKNLITDKSKKMLNNIFSNSKKILDKGLPENTINGIIKCLTNKDYKTLRELLLDISLLGRGNIIKRKSRRKSRRKSNKKSNKKSRRKSKSLKYGKFKGGVVDEDVVVVPECSICYESLHDLTRGPRITLHTASRTNGTSRTNGINHDFHLNCISEWFKHRSICPLCNIEIQFRYLPDPLKAVISARRGNNQDGEFMTFRQQIINIYHGGRVPEHYQSLFAVVVLVGVLVIDYYMDTPERRAARDAQHAIDMADRPWWEEI